MQCRLFIISHLAPKIPVKSSTQEEVKKNVPELTDEQHAKIKEDIKKEKEEFIKQQVLISFLDDFYIFHVIYSSFSSLSQLLGKSTVKLLGKSNLYLCSNLFFCHLQKEKEAEIKKEEKEKLLKMTVPVEHAYVVDGNPGDPQVKERRDFIHKVID